LAACSDELAMELPQRKNAGTKEGPGAIT
jgi:hypothetical protein